MFKKSLWQGLSYLFTFLLVIAITVACMLETFRTAVDSALGTLSSKIETDEDDEYAYTKYVPSDDVLNSDGTGNSNALIAKAIDLNRRLQAEGSVLLKNEKSALPLSKGSNVTLLGVRSHVPLLGSGMGNKVEGPVITLEDALGTSSTTNFAEHYATGSAWTGDEFNISDAVAGFNLNPVAIDAYDKANAESIVYSQNPLGQITESKGGVTYNDAPMNTQFDSYEISIDRLIEQRSDFESSLEEYSDAAIVVLGRPSGEGGIDYTYGGTTDAFGKDEPLALSVEEDRLIEYATSKFDKVIVLINTNSTMEIESLKNNSKISAILWIGHPGAYGTLGIADILSGKVSPSGGLANLYAVYNQSTPAAVNTGDYTFANSSEITDRTVTLGTADHYVVEAEGIYVGYRYYETRYYDAVYNQGNAVSEAGTYGSEGNWNYSEEVSYGFGYGLSYTTFEQTILSIETTFPGAYDIQTTVTVNVENTGSVAGKSIVQVYVQAPYTEGGVEKSAIQLVAYGKTDTIAAGDSDTVTLTIDWQNIASYDSTVKNSDGTVGSYILDPGDYYFAIGNGAHEALNNILAFQGKTVSDGMDANGDADLARLYTYVYSGVDANTYHISKNNTAVHNQIDYADWNYYGGEEVTYLSRSDWSGTWPVEYDNLTASANLLTDLNGKYYTVKTDDDTSGIVWGSTETEHKFYEMAGADWNDYRWEEVLSQMTLQESMQLIGYGGPTIPAIATLGFLESSITENGGNGVTLTLAATKDPDAPWAISSSDKNSAWCGAVFCSASVLASTFNPEINYELGEFIGIESLFTGIPILWGPGLNTHRNAYNGRNGEYYSEDPILSGVSVMEYSAGAQEYGLITAVKHFAFNDQETNRYGIAPFMTEQRAREIELRAFQIAVEADKYEGKGIKGIMTSFSKIGGVECTCSYELVTEILQNEWGFHGYIVTDIRDDTDIWTQVAASGVTGYDMRGHSDITWSKFTSQYNVTESTVSGDATLQTRLKLANKNLLYAMSQSSLMNRYTASSHEVWLMTWWRAVYIVALVAISALLVTSVTMYTISEIKKRKGGVK